MFGRHIVSTAETPEPAPSHNEPSCRDETLAAAELISSLEVNGKSNGGRRPDSRRCTSPVGRTETIGGGRRAFSVRIYIMQPSEMFKWRSLIVRRSSLHPRNSSLFHLRNTLFRPLGIIELSGGKYGVIRRSWPRKSPESEEIPCSCATPARDSLAHDCLHRHTTCLTR